MSDNPEADRWRRREAKQTIRVLREYTARLFRLSKELGDSVIYGPNDVPQSSGLVTRTHRIQMMYRVRVIRAHIRPLALFASQMAVHFELGEALERELALRSAEAEAALAVAEVAVEDASLGHGIKFNLDDHTALGSAAFGTSLQVPKGANGPPPARSHNFYGG